VMRGIENGRRRLEASDSRSELELRHDLEFVLSFDPLRLL
jgi:hypothetical protein